MKYWSLLCLLLVAQAFAQRAIVIPEGAVATVNPLASQAAAYQLENGGNAIDAAITAAAVLGIVDSYNSGVGGGLFALIRHSDGRIEAIDAREMAPARATRDMFQQNGRAVPELSRLGALSIGIPGSVAALEYMANHGGKKPFYEHWLKAAALAEAGFPISQEYANRLARHQQALAQFPETAAIFLHPDDKPLEAGHFLKQSDLANTYRMIAKSGSRYFYQGEFAQAVEAWMQQNGGIVSADDFAQYELKFREPLLTQYQGYTVVGFPPPSSGGVHVAQILNITEALSSLKKVNSEERRLHLLAESMKFAFADRAFWLGDPKFANVPKGLISPQYAWRLGNRISTRRAASLKQHSVPPNWQTDLFDKHTTHIAVADQDGNWVAITTTLNTSFGSKVVIPGTGVLMNNQMDDFSAQPGVPNTYGLVGSEANSIGPGKRPLSSMSPTIILDENKQPVMTLGAAGGPLIITQVVQGIINHLGLGQSLEQAVASPRIHHQWRPHKLLVDKHLSESTRQALIKLGHDVETMTFEGTTNAISRLSGQLQAVSEPRLEERNQPRD